MSAKKNSEKKKGMQNSIQNKVKNPEDTLQQLQQELNGKNDKLLRSYADLQNYQKRMEKELAALEDEIKKKYLVEIIDLYDMLKKAYEDNDPKQGLKLLLNHLDAFFEREQVKYVDCLGKTFDHTIHHAISTVEKENCMDGEIIKEAKKGYYLGEKLLRPSQVIVAKKKALNKRRENKWVKL